MIETSALFMVILFYIVGSVNIDFSLPVCQHAALLHTLHVPHDPFAGSPLFFAVFCVLYADLLLPFT